MNVYNIGVHIAMTNGVSGVLATISRDVLGLHGNVNKLQAGFAAWRPAIMGAAAALGGVGMLKAMSALVDKGNEFIKIQRDMHQAGVDLHTVEEARVAAQKHTQTYTNLGQTDILKQMSDARMVFGDQHHAITEIEPFLRAQSFLKAYQGGEHAGKGEGLLREINAAIKSAEIAGKISPQEAATHVAQLTAMKVAYGDQVKISQYLQAQRTAGVALRNSSDTFRYGIFPALVQENASAAGVMMMTAFNKVVAGVGNTTSALQTMQKLGILNEGSGAIKYDKTGRAIGLNDIGGIKNSDLAAKNFGEWVMTTLAPAIHKKVGDDQVKQAQLISRLLPDRNAAKAVTEIMQQWPKLMKDAELMHKAFEAYSKDGGRGYTQGSLDYQKQSAGALTGNILELIGSPMVARATEALAKLNSHLGSFFNVLAANPALADGIGIALAGVGAGLAAMGTALLGGALLAAVGPAGWLLGGLASMTAIISLVDPAYFTRLHDAFRQLGDSTQIGEAVKNIGNLFNTALMGLPGMVADGISAAISGIGAKISEALASLANLIPGVGASKPGASTNRPTGSINPYKNAPAVPGSPANPRGSADAGNIYLDGHKVGKVLMGSLSEGAAHPVSGITSDRRGYYHDPSSDYVMAG